MRFCAPFDCPKGSLFATYQGQAFSVPKNMLVSQESPRDAEKGEQNGSARPHQEQTGTKVGVLKAASPSLPARPDAQVVPALLHDP